MADEFEIGDVISITNEDAPAWIKGRRWRIVKVALKRVKLIPLRTDGTVDLEETLRRDFWITR